MGWINSDLTEFRETGPDEDNPDGWIEVTDEEFAEYVAQAFDQVKADGVAAADAVRADRAMRAQRAYDNAWRLLGEEVAIDLAKSIAQSAEWEPDTNHGASLGER